MYYAEEIINGVLCHKSTPNGEWIPFTAEQLTSRIVGLMAKIDLIREGLLD